MSSYDESGTLLGAGDTMEQEHHLYSHRSCRLTEEEDCNQKFTFINIEDCTNLSAMRTRAVVLCVSNHGSWVNLGTKQIFL